MCAVENGDDDAEPRHGLRIFVMNEQIAPQH
jgi:hypothetical protein